MATFTKAAAEIFRDYVTDGVPASGAHQPKKSEIRQYGLEIETQLTPAVAGLPYAWVAATSGDPAAGGIGSNNATPASVTEIRISKTGAGAQSFGALIATWDDSTSAVKGKLEIFAVNNRTKWIIGDVTSISDQTTYYAVSLSNVAGGSAFAASDSVAVAFAPSGNAGTTGAAGSSGASAVTETPDYGNGGGTGDRTALVTVTASALLSGGTPSNLVDGATGGNLTDSASFSASAVSGHYIRFDFGAGARRLITEATWEQSTTATHGTWKWQGSNDASSWTDIGADFTLGGSTSQAQTELASNGVGYRYYQLLGVSGTASSSPFLQEVEFKVGRTIVDRVDVVPAGGSARQALTKNSATDFDLAWTDQIGDVFAGLPASVTSLWTFDEMNGAVVQDRIVAQDLDLLATGTPTYEWTAQGLKMRSGVAQAPSTTAARGVFVVYRLKRNDNAGFIVSGGSSSGAGLFADTLSTSYTSHLAGGYGVHTPMFRASNGASAHELNRGGWMLAFVDFGSTYTDEIGFGGRHSTTTSRCTEIEFAAAGVLNGALSDDDRSLIYRVMRRAMKRRGIYLHVDDCPDQAELIILHGESNPHGDELLANFTAGDQALTFNNVFIMNAGSATAASNQAAPAGMVLGLNNRLTDQTRAGPEIGIAKRWRANWLARRRALYILKATLGSTYMAPSGSGSAAETTSWNASSTISGSLFNVALMRSLYDLEQHLRNRGIGLQVSGVAQNIGLNDATNTAHTTDVATYQGYRQDFFDKIKTYTGLSAIYAIIFRTHNSDTASNATALSHVRDAEAALVTANSTTMALVDTDAYGKQSGDAAHFDATGTLAFGEAAYDQLNTLTRFA